MPDELRGIRTAIHVDTRMQGTGHGRSGVSARSPVSHLCDDPETLDDPLDGRLPYVYCVTLVKCQLFLRSGIRLQ